MAYLADQCDARDEYHGQRAVWTQFVYDTHRHPGLAGAAGQHELGSAHVLGQVLQSGALFAPEFGQFRRRSAQHVDAVLDGFVLHRCAGVGFFRCRSLVGCPSQLDQCVLPDDIAFNECPFVAARQLGGRNEPAFSEDFRVGLASEFLDLGGCDAAGAPCLALDRDEVAVGFLGDQVDPVLVGRQVEVRSRGPSFEAPAPSQLPAGDRRSRVVDELLEQVAVGVVSFDRGL